MILKLRGLSDTSKFGKVYRNKSRQKSQIGVPNVVDFQDWQLSGNFCSQAVPKSNPKHSVGDRHYGEEWRGHVVWARMVSISHRLGRHSGDFTSISLPKDRILTEQDATFISRDISIVRHV